MTSGRSTGHRLRVSCEYPFTSRAFVFNHARPQLMDQDERKHREERVQEHILHGVGSSDCGTSAWSCVSPQHICCLSLLQSTSLRGRFIVPAIYYTTRYRLPRLLPTKLLGLGLGIGAQGVLGWFMVKSGLDEQIIQDRAVPRVSQYRLAAHLSAALALYVGMVTTAIGLRRDARASASIRHSGPAAFDGILRALKSPSVSGYKGLTVAAGTMVFLTAVSGAFVAGLDAGLVYNEFPTMGGRLVPPAYELLDKRYAKRADKGDTWWRNVFENPVTAQFDHRLFATTTFTVLLSLPIIARLRRVPLVTRRLADLTAVAAVTQVTLGITTLLYLVPIPIAASHQAGSVVLLTCLMALWGSMRMPSRVVMELRRRMVPATRYT